MFDRLNSGEVLCLMRELAVPRVPSAECLALSGGCTAWLGGGSSAQRRGSVTAVNLHTNAVATEVRPPANQGPSCTSTGLSRPILWFTGRSGV